MCDAGSNCYFSSTISVLDIFICTFFWGARVCWPLLCLCRVAHFVFVCEMSGFEPESCCSKQARYQLSHPSLMLSHPSLICNMHMVYDTIAFINTQIGFPCGKIQNQKHGIFQRNCFDCRLKEGGFSQPTSDTLKKTPSKTLKCALFRTNI